MKQVVIQPGDSVTGLATQHGTDVNTILQANPSIKDPNLIYAGSTLNIPDGTPDQTQPSPSPTPENQTPALPSLTQQFSPSPAVVTSDSVRTQNANITDPIIPYDPSSTYDPLINFNGAPPSNVKTDIKQVNDLRSGLNPPGLQDPGAPPNLAQKYQELRTTPDAGGTTVADLEQQLNQTKASKLNLQGTIANLRSDLSGKGRPQAEVDQAVQEKTQEIADQVDQYTRQEQLFTDQLGVKYNIIDNIMKFTDQDYQNAASQYDREFTQNLRILSAVKGEQSLADSQAQRDQTNARANLQTFVNQITTNGLNYDTLTDDQKTMINKLELQAGLPQGFVAQLQVKNPKANIVSTTTRMDNGKKYADTILKDPKTGALSTQTTFLGNAAKTPASKVAPSPASMFSKPQQAELNSTIGIKDGTLIGQAILNGHPLEDIRQALRASGKDPAALDVFDRVVGIAKFTKTANPKTSKAAPPVSKK